MPPDFMRIAVAMSGGVDSSVVAALLKAQGHDVIGLTMLLREGDSAEDAKQVAQTIGIPLNVIDLQSRFQSCVIDPFADSYLHGETPIPCVLCNRRIKFGDLMAWARKLGASALATGHYACRVEAPSGAQLHRGADEDRDQSYFLFALSQEQIDFLRFPLSNMSKDETRVLAKRFHLPVADKPDSQDICFVPNGDYVSVLEKLRPGAIVPGEIVDQAGRVIGQHQGIVHFTVGQRRGLNIGDRKGDQNEPLFVLALDAITHRVIVGPREALARTKVYLRDVNWLAKDVPSETLLGNGLEVEVRLRSTQMPVSARFIWDGKGEGLVQLTEPVYGLSPGQAGVLYRSSRVLGGGWIAGAA